MTELTVYSANNPKEIDFQSESFDQITTELNKYGIQFERWEQDSKVSDDPLITYDSFIKKLMEQGGYATADVIQLKPDNPNKDELRKKFLSEHTHSEDEVRFFVQGSGLFYIHRPTEERVLAITCTAGDLLSVPALTRHWFDMGPNPDFVCIRVFTDPAGWVADLTGNPIADSFPLYE